MERDPLMNHCVICLDTPTSKDPCIQMKNADCVLFVKTCKCDYTVHQRCIQDWLTKKEICLTCREPLYYDRNMGPIHVSFLNNCLYFIANMFGIAAFFIIVLTSILLFTYTVTVIMSNI